MSQMATIQKIVFLEFEGSNIEEFKKPSNYNLMFMKN